MAAHLGILAKNSSQWPAKEIGRFRQLAMEMKPSLVQSRAVTELHERTLRVLNFKLVDSIFHRSKLQISYIAGTSDGTCATISSAILRRADGDKRQRPIDRGSLKQAAQTTRGERPNRLCPLQVFSNFISNVAFTNPSPNFSRSGQDL